MAIVAMLLGMTVPFVASLRADISMQQVLRQVKVDLISTLNYSLAGKSFGAISKNQLQSTDLIPEAYGLYFQVGEDKEGQRPYSYFEMTAKNSSDVNQFKINYQNTKDYSNSTIYLKSIFLENSKDKSAIEVKNASILIIPPFGKVFFSSQKLDQGIDLNFQDTEKNDESYDLIKLIFQYKEDEKNLGTLSFDRNKILTLFWSRVRGNK